MHPIFHAKQSVEAHVVSHMLEGHEIKTIITGESAVAGSGYGTSDQPFSVCVMSTADIEKARQLIEDWDERNPVDGATHARKKSKNLCREERSTQNILIFTSGFMLGVLYTLLSIGYTFSDIISYVVW